MAATTTAGTATAPVDYLLHLADNALVLGQRNAERCGHGPVLEDDIAMANNKNGGNFIHKKLAVGIVSQLYFSL